MGREAKEQMLIQRNGINSAGFNLSPDRSDIMEEILDQPVIDRGVIAELGAIGMDGALLTRVLHLFEAKVPDAVIGIERLSAAADRKGLADAVHALKSMCANIGALRAAAACHDLECLARGGGDFDAADGVARIAREVAEALREVRLLGAA
jgi:HPt (histidine-containing phosphotransfer) domain-containing protein